jgi:glycerol-3-phosphate dehydrogenase (NAD(P)+)
MKISIIGCGSWGTALANLLTDNQHDVLIYDKDESTTAEINEKHTNYKKLGNVLINNNIIATSSLNTIISFSDIIVLAVPTFAIRSTLKKICEILNRPKYFVNVSKGLEYPSANRVSEILYKEINNKYVKAYINLSGPSHAEEVILRKITSVVAASNNLEDSIFIQEIFSNSKYFRVYSSTDVIGSEVSGALKNIYAIASGIIDSLDFGINSKSAMITRSLVEIKKLTGALGGLESTLNGLVGIGDLIVTCVSEYSRNYRFGFLIGSGMKADAALSEIGMAVEGYKTCETAFHLSKKLKQMTPILDSVYNILFKDFEALDAISNLMKRELTLEF